MKFQCASCSEAGPVRGHNEDAISVNFCEEAGLFLVADGMGGRADGEVVSAKLRHDYARWWREKFLPARGTLDFNGALKELKSVLFRVNREVVRRYGEKTAGSTLALLFLYRGNLACLWAGDSRIYRFRGLSVEQMTRDDVFRSGDARLNGKLTSAVGLRATLEFNLRTDAIRSGDGFFLCSDGVYRFAPPPFLRRKLRFGGGLASPAQVAASIEKEVLKRGARDNYSMIFVKVSL